LHVFRVDGKDRLAGLRLWLLPKSRRQETEDRNQEENQPHTSHILKLSSQLLIPDS
jgi:hypothetical protein